MVNTGITLNISGYIIADNNDAYASIYNQLDSKFRNITYSFTLGGGFYNAKKKYIFAENLSVVIYAGMPRINQYKSFPNHLNVDDKFVALLPRSNEEQHPYAEIIEDLFTMEDAIPIFDYRNEHIMDEIMDQGYKAIFKRYNLLSMTSPAKREEIKKSMGISSLTITDLIDEK